MAKKEQLRSLRSGTIINITSKKQESEIIQALDDVILKLNQNYSLKFQHNKTWRLKDIANRLNKHFPKVPFSCVFNSTYISPDGGILSIVDQNNETYPILISEVKNQGTNDLRKLEGKPKQARGNAIERLGKNVIGLRAALRNESIFPFVCFGYGCDFLPESTILDRVVTIAIFGELCTTYLFDEGPNGLFDRGSYYFRARKWTKEEMVAIMYEIAERSIQYYFAKYKRQTFEI